MSKRKNKNKEWYKGATSFYLTYLEYPLRKFTPLSKIIINELKSTGEVDRATRELKKAISALTLNLYLRYYSFRENGVVNVYKGEEFFYKGNDNKDLFGLAFTSFNAVLKGFEKLGYINLQVGDIETNVNGEQVNRPTKLLATKCFYNLVSEHLDIDEITFPVDAVIEKKVSDTDRNVYRLRHNKLSASNQKKTKQIELEKFNELASNTSITLGDYTFPKSDTFFKRIFHNDFETYGRLHCGALQGLPRQFRPYLTFNTKPTVEVDIVSSHVLIAYALSDYDLTDMPPAYSLKGIASSKDEGDIAKINRTILKQCLLSMINTRSVRDCSEALILWYVNWESKNGWPETDYLRKIAIRLDEYSADEYYKFNGNYESYVIAKAMHSKHKPYISGCLSDKLAGLKLMYIESEIIFDTVNHFVNRGVYCLPIHDSIRIEERYGDELKRMLLNKLQRHLKMKFKYSGKVLELEPVVPMTNEIKEALRDDKRFINTL